MTSLPSISECLTWSELLQSVSDSSRLDVELLLAKAIDKPRAFLYTWPETRLTDSQNELFVAYFDRRKNGEPIAYILEEKEFWSRSFFVSPVTLIPRDDTESLIEFALSLSRSFDTSKSNGDACGPKILDLGTGTGAIGITLGLEMSSASIDAVDLSPEAVELAKKNVAKLAAHNVSVFQSNWFSAIANKYHLIVSNPPYIDALDHHLSEGDVRFEPKSALVASANGLADIQHIVGQASSYLCEGGWLLVEHGCDQGEQVKGIFKDNDFIDVQLVKDLAGRDRACAGTFKSSSLN